MNTLSFSYISQIKTTWRRVLVILALINPDFYSEKWLRRHAIWNYYFPAKFVLRISKRKASMYPDCCLVRIPCVIPASVSLIQGNKIECPECREKTWSEERREELPAEQVHPDPDQEEVITGTTQWLIGFQKCDRSWIKELSNLFCIEPGCGNVNLSIMPD